MHVLRNVIDGYAHCGKTACDPNNKNKMSKKRRKSMRVNGRTASKNEMLQAFILDRVQYCTDTVLPILVW